MLKAFSLLFKTLVPIAILIGGFIVAQYLMETGPEPRIRPPVDRTPVVEVQTIEAQDYPVSIYASGTVKARTQSNLVAEVAGKITEISTNFRSGGYFSAGETLLILDDTNYRDSIRIIESDIAAQQASLQQLDQEQKNTLMTLSLTQNNLNTVQQNLQMAQQGLDNVKRNAPTIQNNIHLIKRNLNLSKQNFNLTKKNLALAQRNLAISRQELGRTQKLWEQRLIARNQVDAEQQKVLQLEQSIVQQEQALIQHQQSAVQLEQQLSQQSQSIVQQDQSTLSQRQQILQQQQAVNQQIQSIESIKGQLATYAARRDAILANIEANKTKLLQQQRNLGRTEIKAPYDGRILEQRVDVGQYTAANSVLGVIYATDYVEVDMPLTLTQFSLLDLPSITRTNRLALADMPTVTLTMPLNKQQTWQAVITGTRAALNEDSRQITLVARIDKPYEQADRDMSSIKIGQYLSATIQGRTYRDVYALPPGAVRQNKEILLMQERSVNIVPIEVVWNTEQTVVVRSNSDLNGQQLIITPLPQAYQGLNVALPGEKMRNRGGAKTGERGEGAHSQGRGTQAENTENAENPARSQSRRNQTENAEKADNTSVAN